MSAKELTIFALIGLLLIGVVTSARAIDDLVVREDRAGLMMLQGKTREAISEIQRMLATEQQKSDGSYSSAMSVAENFYLDHKLWEEWERISIRHLNYLEINKEGNTKITRQLWFLVQGYAAQKDYQKAEEYIARHVSLVETMMREEKEIHSIALSLAYQINSFTKVYNAQGETTNANKTKSIVAKLRSISRPREFEKPIVNALQQAEKFLTQGKTVNARLPIERMLDDKLKQPDKYTTWILITVQDFYAEHNLWPEWERVALRRLKLDQTQGNYLFLYDLPNAYAALVTGYHLQKKYLNAERYIEKFILDTSAQIQAETASRYDSLEWAKLATRFEAVFLDQGNKEKSQEMKNLVSNFKKYGYAYETRKERERRRNDRESIRNDEIRKEQDRKWEIISDTSDCISADKSEAAIAACTRVIDAGVNDERDSLSTAYFFRGDAKRKKGDYAGAIADYNRAIELNPKESVRFNQRGLAKSKLGDLQGALDDYNKALALDPDNLLITQNRDQVLRRLQGQ